jgi:hypothetical protein
MSNNPESTRAMYLKLDPACENLGLSHLAAQSKPVRKSPSSPWSLFSLPVGQSGNPKKERPGVAERPRNGPLKAKSNPL